MPMRNIRQKDKGEMKMGFFGLFEPKEIKELKKKRDIDGLIKVLESGSEKIRKHAAKAIRDLGDRKAIELYITQLIKKVETANEKTILNTMEILENFGDLAIVPLLKALDSSNENTQNVCYTTITSISCGGGAGATEFEKAFDDKSLRKNAARAGAVSYLYVLEEKPFFAETIKGILEKRAQSNIKLFEESLEDSHPKVVSGVVLLLAESTNKETAIKVVKEKFEDESVDMEIRKSILKGLYSLGDIGSEIRDELSFRKTVEVEEAIVRSPESQEALVRDLSSGDAKTRWSAAISLGMQGNPRSIDVLKEILVHGDADTRLEVVESCLKEIKDDRVTELALKALKDGNERVHEECVDIIDELQVKDKRVFIKPLIEIISNIKEKEDIRESSILAIDLGILEDIEDEETVIMIVEALKRAEKDESESVRINAGSVLVSMMDLIVDKKLKIPLEDLFEKDDIEEYKKSRGIL